MQHRSVSAHRWVNFGLWLTLFVACPPCVTGSEAWFGAPIVTPLPMTGTHLATGHFNNDQHLDCAVGGHQGAGRHLLIFHGDGAGSFTLGDQLPCPSSELVWRALVAGDFNGDGRLDLAGTREPTGVYYQEAQGGFQNPPSLVYLDGVPAMYEVLASGDIDGDGYDDLVGCLPRYVYPKNEIYIYWGSSSGLLLEPTVLRVNLYPENGGCEPENGYFTWPYLPKVRDVNGDGLQDLIVYANYFLTEGECGDRDGIGWFEGDGARGFSSPADWLFVWDLPGYQGHELFDIGCVDDDEYPDLVRSDSETGECFFYRGGEDGEFTLIGLVEPGWSSNPRLHDFNLDGALDLMTHENEQEIFRGVGDGTFEATISLPERLYSSQPGDVIALGGPDLVGFRASGGPALVVYPNATGATASVEAVQPGGARLRVTPSVSSGSARFEYLSAVSGLRLNRPRVVTIIATDGKRVRDLPMSRGESDSWVVHWDGRDGAGRLVPAGVFFARVDGVESAARFTIVR